jgi:hypothetical protein
MSMPNQNGRLDKKYIKLKNHNNGDINHDRLLLNVVTSPHNNCNYNNNNLSSRDAIDGGKECPVYQVI